MNLRKCWQPKSSDSFKCFGCTVIIADTFGAVWAVRRPKQAKRWARCMRSSETRCSFSPPDIGVVEQKKLQWWAPWTWALRVVVSPVKKFCIKPAFAAFALLVMCFCAGGGPYHIAGCWVLQPVFLDSSCINWVNFTVSEQPFIEAQVLVFFGGEFGGDRCWFHDL